jgi:hypothetical protein
MPPHRNAPTDARPPSAHPRGDARSNAGPPAGDPPAPGNGDRPASGAPAPARDKTPTNELHVIPDERTSTWRVYEADELVMLSEHTTATEAEFVALAHAEDHGAERVVVHDRYHRPHDARPARTNRDPAATPGRPAWAPAQPMTRPLEPPLVAALTGAEAPHPWRPQTIVRETHGERRANCLRSWPRNLRLAVNAPLAERRVGSDQTEPGVAERIAQIRFARATAPLAAVAPYLPHNYFARDNVSHTLIFGQDIAGWTLDEYVIPRLASGRIHAAEVRSDAA